MPLNPAIQILPFKSCNSIQYAFESPASLSRCGGGVLAAFKSPEEEDVKEIPPQSTTGHGARATLARTLY